MQEGGQKDARVQAIYSLQTHVDWSGSRKCHGTRPHTQKMAMPMTAASVAQRRMCFKALRAQEVSRSAALPGFPRIQQAGSDEQKWKRRAILPLIQQGGVYGHSDGMSPEDGGEQVSEGQSVDPTSAQTASGESSGR